MGTERRRGDLLNYVWRNVTVINKHKRREGDLSFEKFPLIGDIENFKYCMSYKDNSFTKRSNLF